MPSLVPELKDVIFVRISILISQRSAVVRGTVSKLKNQSIVMKMKVIRSQTKLAEPPSPTLRIDSQRVASEGERLYQLGLRIRCGPLMLDTCVMKESRRQDGDLV